ncbi:MAG: hypothetical protein DRZ76_03360 [Candidatus Nealsonbacteria bacterium]|nr:MAG: hypothetical protein DRZ76_03360 [Candidatus Nealsonbacteria bacterium]
METKKIDIEELGLGDDWYYCDLVEAVEKRFNGEVEAWHDNEPFGANGIAIINGGYVINETDETLFNKVTKREPDVIVSEDYNDYYFYFKR